MRRAGGLRPQLQWRTIAVALVLAVFTILPFLSAGGGDFLPLDDDEYVLENKALRGGVSGAGIRWALTAFHAANWHPLTWLSHMVDVSLFGLNPRGHHFSSVLFHASATGLLFAALFRLTGSLWPSAFVAAAFGIHPLRVESVAWISERKDVLSGFLFMLLLLAYERYARRGGVQRYLAVFVLLALGIAAKPMLITAPLVLLLLDYWPLGRLQPGGEPRRGWRAPGAVLAEKLPLLALAVASGLVTLAAQSAGGALRPLEVITPAMRLANALVSYAAYLGKTVWPSGLAVYYPHPFGGISLAKLVGAGLLITGVTAAAFLCRRTLPFLAVGWCWYVVTLLPVIGIVQVGQQSMADRYTYLPLIGPVFAVSWAVAALARRQGTAAVTAATAIGVALLVSLTVLTVRQAGYWRDGEILFRRGLAVTRDNWLIHNNLAIVLRKMGRPEEALEHLRESLRINPTQQAEVYNDIGNALAALGRRGEAIDYYRRAVFLRPEKASTRYNFALTLATLGRNAEAESEYREAIRLLPDFPAAHTDLGRLLASLGRRAEAETMYLEAIRLDSEYALARLNLGVLLARGGQFREAEASFREAVRLQPEMTEPRINLGFALLSQMRHAEAEAMYRDVLRRAPESYPALAGLGRVLAAQGRREEAAASYREALRVNPGAEETQRDLEALAAR